MKVKDVHLYLRSLCGVIEPSVDRVIVGDPDGEVTRIGTAWMAYWKTCREAVADGINTLVVHECTFYSHWDRGKAPEFEGTPPEAWEAYERAMEEKKGWIENNGLAIIRCHDVLDKVPEFGIPFALGQGLGFSNTDIIRSKQYYNVYAIEPRPARAVAELIASKLAVVGQPGVAFYGDPERTASSVGLGTGFISNPLFFMDMNPDLYITIDDVTHTCIQATYAEDTGHPLVVINHGTSEEFGMRLLSDNLRGAFPDVEVVHLDQGCGYQWISA